MPSIRPGFPVVASNTGGTAPYTVLTDVFSANHGDELLAVVMGGGLPQPVSRNAANTGAGTLKWNRRFVTRSDYTNTSTNVGGAHQVAYYTAVVPPGGVTERASYTTTTTANDGGQTLSPNNLPARLAVIAVYDTNGVGAIGWKGSISTGSGGSNDITTGSPATQTIKPFGTGSLLIGGGWFVNGSFPRGVDQCQEIVAPGSNRMPVWTRIGGAAGVDVLLGSDITDSTLWALGLIEYLPTTTPKPTHKIFCFGDSGIESTSSARQTAVVVQDTLAPNYELFNQAVWWSHTAQVLSRWTADSASFPHIDIAIVQVGFNDVNDGGNVWSGTSQTNLASLYSGLSGVPLACYTTPGPLATPGVAPAGYYDFRDWVQANAPAGSHFYSTDLVADPAAGYLGILAAYVSADGGHIDAAGNAITGADIAAWISTLPIISISAHPADQTVNDGATATFSVTASGGTAPLSYQWRKNGTNIGGATSSSYSPTAAYADQGALFDCVIGDAAGLVTTSNAGRLRVAFNLSGTGARSEPLFGGGWFGGGPFGFTWWRAPASGGATATLAGDAAAIATAAAALSLLEQLAGAAHGQGSASGDLARVATLAGAAQGQGSAAGDLVRAATLAGAAQAQATASAAIAKAAGLAGAAAGQGSASGQLAIAVLLNGSAAAVASSSGMLATAGGVDLGGAASGQASASAALQLSVGLAAAAVGQVLAAGDLSHGVPLAGAGAGQGLAGGALSHAVALNGAAVATSTASGQIALSIALAGAALGQASAQGAFTGIVTLGGAAAAQAGVAGSLSLVVPLGAQARAIAAATGGLVVTLVLGGAGSGLASAAGGLAVAVQLSGAAGAVAAAVGSLSLAPAYVAGWAVGGGMGVSIRRFSPAQLRRGAGGNIRRK